MRQAAVYEAELHRKRQEEREAHLNQMAEQLEAQKAREKLNEDSVGPTGIGASFFAKFGTSAR